MLLLRCLFWFGLVWFLVWTIRQSTNPEIGTTMWSHCLPLFISSVWFTSLWNRFFPGRMGKILEIWLEKLEASGNRAEWESLVKFKDQVGIRAAGPGCLGFLTETRALLGARGHLYCTLGRNLRMSSKALEARRGQRVPPPCSPGLWSC